MSLIPVLTAQGRNAIQAAQGTGSPVKLTTAALGSASRVPNGVETALVAEVCRTPIGGYALDPATGQLDLGAVFTSATLGIVADHTICEVGFFDAAGELIYYYATNQGSLGAITAQSDYALALSVVLAQADAAAIQIVSDGSAQEVVLLPRVTALEAKTVALQAASAALPAGGAPVASEADLQALAGVVTQQGGALAALPPAGAPAAAQADLNALSARVTTLRRRAVSYAFLL